MGPTRFFALDVAFASPIRNLMKLSNRERKLSFGNAQLPEQLSPLR